MASISDFPPQVQAKLAALDHQDFTLMGCEAARMRHEAEIAELPTDPVAAINTAFAEMRADAVVSITDPADFVAAGLNVVGMALESGDLDSRQTADLHLILSHVIEVFATSKARTSTAQTVLWSAKG
jgi:hypothetical protein